MYASQKMDIFKNYPPQLMLRVQNFTPHSSSPQNVTLSDCEIAQNVCL